VSAAFGYFQLRSLRSERRQEKYQFKLFEIQRKLEFAYDLDALRKIETDLKALWKALLEAVRKKKVRTDKNFNALRAERKETEDELHRKIMEASVEQG
jgi:hypothetical protein